MQSHPKLDSLKSQPANTYIVLSNNAATGGTCFGDSGGPTFDNTSSNLVVGVTSWARAPTAAARAGYTASTSRTTSPSSPVSGCTRSPSLDRATARPPAIRGAFSLTAGLTDSPYLP